MWSRRFGAVPTGGTHRRSMLRFEAQSYPSAEK